MTAEQAWLDEYEQEMARAEAMAAARREGLRVARQVKAAAVRERSARQEQEKTRIERIIDGTERGPGARCYRYLHELVCIACGRYVANVPSDQPQPRQLLVPRGLRCSACGGAPIPSGDSKRVLQPYDDSADDDDKPRRGRPPKVTEP